MAAAIFRHRCVFRGISRRLLSPAANKIVGLCARRGLIDESFPSASDHILLHQPDFPPMSDDFMKPVSSDYFREKYGNMKKIVVYDSTPRIDDLEEPAPISVRRLAVVLPLKLRLGILPMPLIVDTGAPSTVYVGTKVVAILKEFDAIKDVFTTGSEFQYIIQGSLGDRINPVYAHQVPLPYETKVRGTFGDVRCNILGLKGIALLMPQMLNGFRESSLK